MRTHKNSAYYSIQHVSILFVAFLASKVKRSTHPTQGAPLFQANPRALSLCPGQVL